MRQQDEMTQLGLAGLAPFALCAVALWISPFIIPEWIAMNVYKVTLVYGGIIVAYMAGAGAGGLLGAGRPANEPFLPGMVAALVAWFAVWPPIFSLDLSAVWRILLLVGALGYLLMRDLRAVEAGGLPAWYAPLRVRLTFWASMLLLVSMSRLLLLGY